MAKDYHWEGDRIVCEPPSRPKKITGTRFASILGKNVWNTPFQTWCEITRTYSKPFEDNQYTLAGKTIEPKVGDYLERIYFGKHLIRPTDVYGSNPFKTTYGDFFKKESPIFGGMWDFLVTDEDGAYEAVVEVKTTKRAEDWTEDDAPEYYELQAALYAWLLGVDTVHMVGVMLEDSDYANPEDFVPSAKNTVVQTFEVSEKYPEFAELVAVAEDWWTDHVLAGVSPGYNEKVDADYLKALRTDKLTPTDEGIESIIAQAEALQAKVEALKEIERQLKGLEDQIKAYMSESLTDGSDRATISGKKYRFNLLKSTRTSVDSKALKDDGLYEQYLKVSEVLTLKKELIEDQE